ncbi:hypothetical protein F8M41_001557 [Gigaspora margarita]|uniref:Uncharacterized protein n=1 Tax=Gigaspora margarita TaxID=4874 RepID=A0A8H4A8Z3_GIGMA|nr:hypothetical protein F8M41_001557 [Gigaspora margarita]
MQQVEIINAIIKTTLTSKTGLCELRAKIAEALWYNLTLIPKENMNINFIHEQRECNFSKDLDDFPAMNISEVLDLFTLPIKETWEVIRYGTVSKVASFYILMISRHWYTDNNYSKSYESLKSEPSISYQDARAILVSNSILNLSSTYHNLDFDN